ncbi:hypothetical protein [Micromonospora sp. NPDC023814]|uniref:hypothetical protein n=1 Tax=Micromonospora sp. NPDC023814 TaxID=3154596 RepID=UPI0033C29502
MGPGGVGKTRLTCVVAAAAARSFPLGTAFVDLVPVRDDFVARAVATALGVTERAQQPLLAAIAERLGQGRTLLMLDNCEHLLDPVAGFVERILSACPDTTVLATSRERLAVPGEQVVPVAPLPPTTDAVALFHDRARAFDPDFSADPALVAELCTRLGEAAALTERAFGDYPQSRYEPYARAAAAELAVVAGLPDAAERLATAAVCAENDWAVTCLTRAAGRWRVDRRAPAAR